MDQIAQWLQFALQLARDWVQLAGDSAAKLQALVGTDPLSWAQAVIVLGSLCSAVACARLARTAERFMLPWFILGAIPVIGQIALAYLAAQPDRRILKRLDMIQDILVRGLTAEQLKNLVQGGIR